MARIVHLTEMKVGSATMLASFNQITPCVSIVRVFSPESPTPLVHVLDLVHVFDYQL